MAARAPTGPPRRHRSSAVPLALAYVALIVYASLYPFEGWTWPPGQGLGDLATLPWTHWYGTFDVTSNVLGYLPLGALLLIAARRSGLGARRALALAIALPAALSYSCEVLQQFVPGRVASMEDLMMNSLGALAGALLAQLGHRVGAVDRWHALRGRWFARDSAGALALLALWPVGLLFPTPVPLGLGQVGERLRAWLADLLSGVPWAATLQALLATPAPPAPPLRPLGHGLIVMLGLLAPCLLAQSVMAPGWRRLAMALGALGLGLGGMTLSTALNFGPEHALAWLTVAVPPGLALGLVLALAAAPLPPRVVAGLALVALTGLVVGVAQAPADPYFAQSLQAWEQGRFVRFHGLTQWVGWLWPYTAIAWLLARLAAPRDPGPQRSPA
ncbi:MAG: VanZ family protein [Burkholderiales bacterium]|nr:VanZ family protein [Burkholderiales bacterium]MDE2277269.1 VanZ family protein [Burkholderiales bacterium]